MTYGKKLEQKNNSRDKLVLEMENQRREEALAKMAMQRQQRLAKQAADLE